MKIEQFEQILAAILSGKYSWACLLILRFAGYNPLHYLPYRTYRRLIKNNNQTRSSGGLQKQDRDKDTEPLETKSSHSSEKRPPYQINDLSYLALNQRL
jgi:hypothetical protein